MVAGDSKGEGEVRRDVCTGGMDSQVCSLSVGGRTRWKYLEIYVPCDWYRSS